MSICGIFWKYTDEILDKTRVMDLSDCHVISQMLEHHKFNVVNYKRWYDIGNVDSLKKTRDTIPDRFHLLDKDDETYYNLTKFLNVKPIDNWKQHIEKYKKSIKI